MALSAGSVWEIRPSAGSDTNGGGFDPTVTTPGTDFSQQNGTQQAYTDLVAPTSTTLTSAARPFSSVDVGNFLRVVSGTGWTTGIFVITSVTGATATVDRTIATAASTGGNANLGGALATLQTGVPSYSGADTLSGHVVYIKASGTMTVTATITLNSHVKLIGYTTTRTDNGRVTITTATNSTRLFSGENSGYNQEFWNLKLTNTAGTRDAGWYQASGDFNNVAWINCLWDGFTYAIDGGQASVFASTQYHYILKNSEIKNSTVHGMRLYDPRSMIFLGCYIHDNTGDGIRIAGVSSNGGMVTAIDCVIKSNTGKGINQNLGGNNAVTLIVRNCALLNNTSDGIYDDGTSVQLLIENCIIDANGGYGVNVNTVGTTRKVMIFGGNNAYRANTSGARLNFSAQPGDVTLTGDPFTNRSGADFSLNATAGAGAACAAAGAGLGF
jgi:hypothetical protein